MCNTYLKSQNSKLLWYYKITICKEQTLDPKDYILLLYLVNTYSNIYSKDYAFDSRKNDNFKFLLYYYTFFI